MSVSPGRPGCCRCGPLFWLLHPHHLGGKWQEQLCGFGRAGTATLSSLMRSPADERTHEDTAGTAGFPIKPSEGSPQMGAQSPQMAGLRCARSGPGQPSPAPQPTGVGPGVTSLQNRQVTPTSASGHLYYFFVFLQPMTVASPITTQADMPCPAQLRLSISLLWLQADNAKGQGQVPYVTPGYPSSAQRFPSLFLAAELQFRVICVRSAKQTFVLQTELAEPALDLYFSVCIWTPSPCRWKLMSSLSPGIQSERRNCTAIWSSSAQCSHRKLSLQLRIKL